MRIADPDRLAVVNLNRLPASVCDLGAKKAHIAARRVYEINPFQELEVLDEGVLPERIAEFLLRRNRPVDLFVEEMDNLYLKIQARRVARDLRIPVVMATDNGDNAFVDVERFDEEPNRALFHGSISEETLAAVPEVPTQADRVRIAATIVGSDITPRTQRSLQLVGSQLPSWPQLGNAATVSGAAVSYVARRILTGQDMPSGRYHIRLDAALEPRWSDSDSVKDRDKSTNDFTTGLAVLFGIKV
jgi:hypothetical protein